MLYKFTEYMKESFPRQQSVEQLKRLRKMTKSMDIDDKTREEGSNLLYHSNPIDNRIESYEDYINSGRKSKLIDPTKIS